MTTINRKWLVAVTASLLLAAFCVLLFNSNVSAHRIPVGANLTFGAQAGLQSVTVPPNAVISVEFTVDLENDSHFWSCTTWSTGPTSGEIDHANHINAGTYVEVFDITAPAAVGTYDLSLDAALQSCFVVASSDGLDLLNAITVVEPTVEVTKIGGSVSKVGDLVTYDITIENTSNILPAFTALNLVSVSDDVLGDLTATALNNGCGTLASGASCNFTSSRTVQGGDPDPLVNTVTVEYNSPEFSNITDTDSHSVNLVDPDFTVDKSCAPSQVRQGDPLVWTITIDNTGDTPLDYQVEDPTAGLNQAVINHGPADAPIVIQANHLVLASDPDEITNTVTVMATLTGDILPNVLNKTATSTCTVIRPVGGVIQFFPSSSGSSTGSIALLVGGIVVAIIAAGWYTRRRWLGSRS